jgi:hypothetical protein
MDEKRFHQIIRGDYSNLPKDKSKIVRIFLSSTFSGILNYFLKLILIMNL